MHENLTRSADGKIFLGDRPLSTRTWAWEDAQPGVAGGDAILARDALAGLATTRPLAQLVVGVIGPRNATAQQLEAAEAVGQALGALGVTMISGGRSGVMEAASKGCHAAGGLPIGILPGTDPSEANPFVAVPLCTGLKEARNIVIVRAARVLIAVGNSPGTLTEVAYGLHFSKPVIGVAGAADLEGVQHCQQPEDAVEAALWQLLTHLPVVEAA